ncbi:MAG: hypothetical protein ACI4IA_05900 [Acutalibacteraceae bacterium]
MTEIKKVKITVLRTNYYEDLMAEYGAEGIGVCELHAPRPGLLLQRLAETEGAL